MAGNHLCGGLDFFGGLDILGGGSYTAEGITKLCEGLQGSAVTSLRCAAARVFAFVSAPADTPVLRPFALAVWQTTQSVA